MAGGEEGREGDWDCGSCRNRNYAFRSLCNRCKQPRLLVDTMSPSDSKWLPRIGDWICPGCSNNNFASREKCKKCAQPKDEAVMPAIAMQGASCQPHYLSRAQGLHALRLNYGMMADAALQQSLLSLSSWPYGGVDKYGSQLTTTSWPFGEVNYGFSHGENANQLLTTPKGWRSGDWICNCGFHNYSSRSQCKKCNAPLPSGAPSLVPTSTASGIFPALGTKRVASEEFLSDWDNKRFNAGDSNTHLLGSRQQLAYQGFDSFFAASDNQFPGIFSKCFVRSLAMVSGMQMHVQCPQQAMTPTLIGKGQWRDGDWMCANCNNHNFASRVCCNRCKTEKEVNAHPLGVV